MQLVKFSKHIPRLVLRMISKLMKSYINALLRRYSAFKSTVDETISESHTFIQVLDILPYLTLTSILTGTTLNVK